MALANPAADLASFLNGSSAGGVALVLGSNLFVGPMRPEPANAVFLLNTGGGAATSYLGGERRALFRPSVQVLVRGVPRNFEEGEALARGVLELVHLAEVPKAAGGGTYVAIVSRDSAPTYLADDDSRRPLWSLNLECQYRGSAGGG